MAKKEKVMIRDNCKKNLNCSLEIARKQEQLLIERVLTNAHFAKKGLSFGKHKYKGKTYEVFMTVKEANNG